MILSHRYRKYIISAFEDNGLTCDIYCECEDARTAITLAEHGLGVAILPSSMRELNPCLYAYSIKDTNLSTEILLAWRNERIPVEVEKFHTFRYFQTAIRKLFPKFKYHYRRKPACTASLPDSVLFMIKCRGKFFDFSSLVKSIFRSRVLIKKIVVLRNLGLIVNPSLLIG